MRALVTLALLLASAPAGPENEPARAVDFEAKDLEGNEHRLSEGKGKVVLLNFWGIWCASCRQEIPRLVELERRYRDEGLVVLGIDTGDAPEDLVHLVAEHGITYPVLVGAWVADDYGVLVYPTSVVIDRDGRIRHRAEGYREDIFQATVSMVKRLLESS
jgi:thiol-disulfide isomerase/thioredoxin